MKIRAVLFTIATLACAIGAPAALAGPAQPVVLRQAIVVDDNFIRLGDLFAGVTQNAETAVAYAPAPGRRAVFDARWLYRVAQAYGLNWRPMTLDDQAVISRASTIIGREEIEQHILSVLVAKGVGPNAQVELSNRMFRIEVAEGANPNITVEDVMFDGRANQFTAIVGATADNAPEQRFRVAGRVVEVREVPALSRRVLSGDIIRKGDVETVSVPGAHLRRDTIIDERELIGKAAKRTLRPGQPIQAADVQNPVLVPRRGLVTIVYQRSRITLTAKGRALEDGSDGDVIRVANTQSNTVIDAVVVGPNTVSVRAPFESALTN